jgi:hypothetical protein
MKNYLLTVIGSFETESEYSKIAMSLTPIVDSPNLKFQFRPGLLLFHFESDISKIDIYAYVAGILCDITDTFILTEINDNITLCFPKETNDHLMDLETTGKDIDIHLSSNNSKPNMDFTDFDEDDDFISILLDEREKFINKVKPSLDQLLDKILKSGFDSLSNDEKNILESYSKK